MSLFGPPGCPKDRDRPGQGGALNWAPVIRCIGHLAEGRQNGIHRQGRTGHRRRQWNRPRDSRGVRAPRRQGGGGRPRRGRGASDHRHHPPERLGSHCGDGRCHQVRGREGLREGGAREIRPDRLLLQQRWHRGQACPDRGVRRGGVGRRNRRECEGGYSSACALCSRK
jgi:hypothetical protein